MDLFINFHYVRSDRTQEVTGRREACVCACIWSVANLYFWSILNDSFVTLVLAGGHMEAEKTCSTYPSQCQAYDSKL